MKIYMPDPKLPIHKLDRVLLEIDRQSSERYEVDKHTLASRSVWNRVSLEKEVNDPLKIQIHRNLEQDVSFHVFNTYENSTA